MLVKETEHPLQLAPMDRLLRKAGAYRVSEEAKKALREAIEKFANDIAQKAVNFAKHANRTTIKDKDIVLAVKELR